MRNAEIAAAFSELATLYELDGANRYRVLAYKEAARVIRDCPHSVAELAREGRATELQGVGETLQTKIVSLLGEGEIPSAAKLKKKLPATLVEITRLPGVGAKTVRKMYDELGIATLEDLRIAAAEHRLRGVKGLGAKLEENVLEELDRIEAEGPEERRLLSEVLEIGEQLVADLRAHPASGDVELAGSARRWAETCKDIDIVATATGPEARAEALLEHELADERLSSGSGGASVRTHNGLIVDLRIVPPEEYGNLLQHFTGSKEHNVKLRERALGMALSVSEHGVTDTETGEVHACATETEVYERLGLRYIEPELREGGRELELAEADELPELVDLAEIRGDLHCHTTLSDGSNTLDEMVEAARRRGYSYLAITDHSATHGFGDDVQADALLDRVAEIHDVDAATKRIKVLAGSEVNVGPDGSLDYDDDVLAELDWVIASIHTSFRMSGERMTRRIISAIEHPLVDCIGHLTGRLLLRRDPYELAVEPIFEAAAANGTMIEINASPRRRDLNEGHARLAADAGVLIAINTDAHRTATLDNMRYGVATARRAGLGPEQVANTRTWRSFAPLRKRTRAGSVNG
jgi:DNA polymerase (family 10)